MPIRSPDPGPLAGSVEGVRAVEDDAVFGADVLAVAADHRGSAVRAGPPRRLFDRVGVAHVRAIAVGVHTSTPGAAVKTFSCRDPNARSGADIAERAVFVVAPDEAS